MRGKPPASSDSAGDHSGRCACRLTSYLAAHEAIEAIANAAQEVDLAVPDFNTPNLPGAHAALVAAGR